MNYTNWKPKKWKTNVSELEYLFFESLSDSEKGLIITLSNSEGLSFEVLFENHPVYRNILEEYKLNLWAIRDEKWPNLGNTWIIENSDWLEQFEKEEPLLSHHEGKLQHYIITTQSSVIEVLSNDNNPKIKTVHNKV
jgi:hypothetical protein